MFHWYEGLPPSLKAAVKLLGALLSAFAGNLSQSLQPYGFLVAAALALWVVVGAAWHLTNTWREKRSKARLVFEPTHLIAIGFIVIAVGFIWQAISPSHAPNEELLKKIDALQSDINKFIKPRELSDAQAKIITDFLLPRTKYTVQIFFSPSDEANSYAGQLMSAFKAADWDIVGKGIHRVASRPDLPSHEGVGIYAALPQGSKASGKAFDLASEALAKAQVKHRGSGSLLSETDTEYVVIVIGPRETR